jgi:hypothetical protein
MFSLRKEANMNITHISRLLFFKLEYGKCEDRRIFRLNLNIFPMSKHEHRLIHCSWNNKAMNESIASAILRLKGA